MKSLKEMTGRELRKLYNDTYDSAFGNNESVDLIQSTKAGRLAIKRLTSIQDRCVHIRSLNPNQYEHEKREDMVAERKIFNESISR